MHSHLHTPENANCAEVMNALDECHARGFLYKALGNCNDVKHEVNKCLSNERWARAKRNRDQAREKRKRVEKLWADERALEQGFPASSSSPGSNPAAGAAAAGEGEKK